MTYFSEFFDDRIFVINLRSRPDRLEHFNAMWKRTTGLDFATLFVAVHGIVVDGKMNGNAGCVASHRALLELQIKHGWPRIFICEDDAEIIYRDFHERWARFADELPADWQMLYLGGGYGEKPQKRVSKHVVRANAMMTTSSYGITLEAAKIIAPHLTGVGPIDSLYGRFNRELPTYVIEPRVCVQYPNVSDLQDRHMDNSASMLDQALVPPCQ